MVYLEGKKRTVDFPQRQPKHVEKKDGRGDFLFDKKKGKEMEASTRSGDEEGGELSPSPKEITFACGRGEGKIGESMKKEGTGRKRGFNSPSRWGQRVRYSERGKKKKGERKFYYVNASRPSRGKKQVPSSEYRGKGGLPSTRTDFLNLRRTYLAEIILSILPSPTGGKFH